MAVGPRPIPIITPDMREAVRKAAGVGLSLRQIARIIVDPGTMKAISVRQLEKHFKNDIEEGMASANLEVSSKLLDLCRQGNVHAILWWEKTRQGRYEKRDFRGMANNGELDLKSEHLAKLSNEQIHALEAVLKVIEASGKPLPRALPPPKLVEVK